MIICIDGPAGAGKSTAAKSLAQRLGFRFLDTGAMYRAVALAAVRRGIDLEDPGAVASVAGLVEIQLDGNRVLLDGEDVAEAIRTAEITGLTHYAADNPQVRRRLVELQRQAAEGHNVVSEGRDQGTVVFPKAECKIFLTAGREERARRRRNDLARRGEVMPLDEVLRRQDLRDRRDSYRAVGPLVAAEDAIHVSTDGLTVDEVLEKLESLVKQRMSV